MRPKCQDCHSKHLRGRSARRALASLRLAPVRACSPRGRAAHPRHHAAALQQQLFSAGQQIAQQQRLIGELQAANADFAQRLSHGTASFHAIPLCL